MTILPMSAKWSLHFFQQPRQIARKGFCIGCLAEFAPFAARRPIFITILGGESIEQKKKHEAAQHPGKGI